MGQHCRRFAYRLLLAFVLMAGFGSGFGTMSVHADEMTPKARYDVLSWPRMSVDAFGCLLEKEFGYRDPHFNCSLKDYENNGDPCKSPKVFNEGPVFPESKVGMIHELIDSLQVSYEHGEVQSVWITMKKPLSRNTFIRIFDLPNPLDMNRPNVTEVDIVKCSILPEAMFKCLNITGFRPVAQCGPDCLNAPEQSSSKPE